MENNKMKVNIDDLQNIIVLLFSNLKESLGDVIEVHSDFYWEVLSKELYNPYVEPNQLTLGQLSDDWNEIKRLTESSTEAIPYDLKRVSNIIKALAIENAVAF